MLKDVNLTGGKGGQYPFPCYTLGPSFMVKLSFVNKILTSKKQELSVTLDFYCYFVTELNLNSKRQ